MTANRWLVAALLAVLLLTACSGAPQEPAPTATPTPQPSVLPPVEEPAASPLPPEPTVDNSGFDPLGPSPQGDSQLKASDPNAVSLANGQPTLVEFFAFW
jgi:hypothetical protein